MKDSERARKRQVKSATSGQNRTPKSAPAGRKAASRKPKPTRRYDFTADIASDQEVSAYHFPDGNPRAFPLGGESDWLIEDIELKSEGLLVSSGVNGHVRLDRSGGYIVKRVPSTEECCRAEIDVTRTIVVDIRYDIPDQAVRELHQLARDVLHLIGLLEGMEDLRPLDLIRRFAAHDPLVVYRSDVEPGEPSLVAITASAARRLPPVDTSH